jgi:hypothetical protein
MLLFAYALSRPLSTFTEVGIASPRGYITTVGTFPVPGSTSLTVTAYTGDTLTLATQSGTVLIFNLDSLTYG